LARSGRWPAGAAASGAPLAPRQLILDIRDRLYHHPGEQRQPDGATPLISDEVLWSCTTCTTCMACVEACLVGIEHVPTIIDMRRGLIEKGEMDPLLAQTLQKIGTQGNSYGKSARTRPRWTKPLDFTIPDARKEPVQYVWFVEDYASFDERVQQDSQRLARVLTDVRCEAIFTTDPHSLNTLRNKYPRYGLDKPVYHHTELLLDLVASGRLPVPPAVLAGTRVTYHDPCYLAPYNGITDAPRALIAATGAELVEMPRHGAQTFCCGAGGGRIWMGDSDDVAGERPSEQRIREAQTLGAIDHFVVSCPKDLAMYSAAAQTVGADFDIIELTALLERALAASEVAALGAAS
jgi:Fe-S oxidoreductase